MISITIMTSWLGEFSPQKVVLLCTEGVAQLNPDDLAVIVLIAKVSLFMSDVSSSHHVYK